MNQVEDNEVDNKNPFLKVWVTAPVAFLVLAGVIVFLVLSRDDFQREQVSIMIESPDIIEVGSDELIEVVLNNNSKIPIQDVRIAVHLPSELVFYDNTKSKFVEVDVLSSREKHRVPLVVSAVSGGSSVEIDARADYSPKDINARFSVVMKKEVLVGELSVDVEIGIPDEIYKTETINGLISITPNAYFDKESLYARILSDDGFAIKESVPEFSRDDSWRLDTLVADTEQKIEFLGEWEGVTDSFVLVFEIGRYEGLEFIPLFKEEKQIIITSSPMLLVIEKQGEDKIKSGSEVVFDVVVQNKGDEAISNLQLNASLPSSLLEKRTATGGFGSRVTNNVVSWSYEHIDELKRIEPQSEISTKLEFRIKEFDSISVGNDGTNLDVEFNAEALIEGRGSLYQSVEKSLEITGEPKFTQVVLRESGNFPAEGPFPPEVGRESSFVVKWRIKNSINELNNIQVSTILPGYVDYGGSTYPISRNIFYDEKQKKIVWELSSLRQFETKEISFVIWAVPRSSHEGSNIELLRESIFKAFDPTIKEFTDKRISGIDSSLPDDTTINTEEGLVQD